MFAAPVLQQSASGASPTTWETGMSTTTVWIPPGSWVQESTGTVNVGVAGTGSLLTKAYDLSETPVWVRAGALVPTIRLNPGDTVGVAGRQYTALEFAVYPGEWRVVDWLWLG